MKNKKSTLIAIPLLLAMLFVSLAPFVVPVKAGALAYNNGEQTIYYFNDYYPTASQEAMSQAYPDYNSVYYHEWVTEDTLFEAVMRGMPTGANIHTVIIDIKSFIPSGATLNAIFSFFVAEGCRTVFVTPYDQTDFATTNFIGLLDLYYKTGMDSLDQAINEYLDQEIPEMFDEERFHLDVSHTIVLDGRLMNLNDLHMGNLYDRISNSPFMKRLIDALAERGEVSATDYSQIVQTLLYEFGIDVLIHTGEDDFLSLATYTTHETTHISDLCDMTDNESVSVFAFWRLSDDLNAMIAEENGSYPVHVKEADPFIYGEDGLSVTVHSTDGSGEEGEFLAALRTILQ